MRGGGRMSPAPRRPSVLLVREAEHQLTSSGCCGRLEGDFLRDARGRPALPEKRAAVEELGPLYRALRARYGQEIDLQIVDPRSFVTLLPLLVRDFRRYGVGVREALRTLTSTPVQGVIVNGRLVARGDWPSADSVVDAIEGGAGGR